MAEVPNYFIKRLKRKLQQNQLSASDKVIKAFEEIPRKYFIDSDKSMAYKDRPLPIPRGQTISAPHMYAMMLSEELTSPRMGMDILEIGTGSGYGGALLAYVVNPGKVITIERHKELVKFAKNNLSKIDLDNIEVIHDDGTNPELDQKFDRILVTAAGPKIPETLLEHMKSDGKMIIPIEENAQQWLSTVEMEDGEPIVNRKFRVRFVPLVGEEGFDK